MMHGPLTTERLTLRPLTLADAEALHQAYGDLEAMRFMPTLPHQSVAETRQHLKRELSVPGAVHWTICRRDDNAVIGQVNYLGQTLLPGMGYILQRAAWGQGYATEACRAALEYGFANLGLDRVELWINEENFASQRVAQKLGFRLKGTLPLRYQHESNHHIMQVYGLWAHEWQSNAPSGTETTFFSAQPVLLVRDVAASAAYFHERLGFRIDFLYGDPPTHGGVSRGDWTGRMVTLQLSQAPTEAELQPAGYLYIMVDATIDALFAQYQRAGVEIIAEPKTQPWGMREFTIREPNGHQLRFGTHV
ncbi:MAG: GNAT family N-acetyltransferase [Caldilineaceae bacterium]